MTALAGVYEARKLVTGEAGVAIETGPLVIGVVASLVSGLLAIHFLLRYLRSHPTYVFIVYRIALAAVVAIAFLAR